MGKLSVSADTWLTGCEASIKKYEKIWNWYENCKRPRRNHTLKVIIWNWYEKMKLMIWEFETDLKIAFAQFDILTFLCIVPTWTFSMFILDAAGMKIHLAGIKTRSQRKNGLRSSYVDVCNFQYGETQREWQLVRRKNVSVGLRR